MLQLVNNVLNESALASIQDKLYVILNTEAEVANFLKVSQDVTNATLVEKVSEDVTNTTIIDESGIDPYVCSRPLMNVESTSLSDFGSKICVIKVELATAISSIFNFVQCIT